MTEVCGLVWRFNPRLHAGGDVRFFDLANNAIRFNPRLHAGGDLVCR